MYSVHSQGKELEVQGVVIRFLAAVEEFSDL